MGRQAFPIVGGLIGAGVAFFATGGTATLQGYEAGFAIGAAIGGIAGSYIDPILIQGNKVGDNALQAAAEGGARAIMFGRACVSATCLIARGNRVVTKKKTSNGKGSSGSTQNETVTWTFAIGLCEAIPHSSICRIWQDETLVYDVLGDGSVSDADNMKFAAKFRFYDGNETQLPDPDLQVFLSTDTPYFRGTAYVVFPNFDLTLTGERIPIFRFEILNGVAGIIDELETLSWDFPTFDHLVPISDSVTLTGDARNTLNVDMWFTGFIQIRDYANVTARIGGGGRFITATNGNDVTGSGWNMYRIDISDPPQTFYINSFLPSEYGSPSFDITLDGSDDWKLSCQMAGNATVTFFADPIDGKGGPEHCTVRCEVTGIEIGTTGTITLASVVDDLAAKSGMDNADIDTSALTHLIAGVCIETSVTGADAINSCVQPFFADPCERDGVLTYVKRGGDVLRTLTIDDLTEEPDVASRENVIEYPAKLSFFYQSPATGYETTKATSYRYSPQADSSGEGSVTAPITFYGGDEPAQIAAKLHKVMWNEAEGSFSWSVGTQCIDLIPTDVVGLYLRGILTRARIIATESDGTTIKLSMLKDRQSSYTSAVTTIPLPGPTAPLPTTMSRAVLAVLDIPALQDGDDSLEYYTAMSGSTQVWSGGELQRSLDTGVTWNAIGEVTTDTTMGRLTAVVPAADPLYTDTTNSVTVQLFDSRNELVSLSDTAFLQEQGAFALELADGTWEILQYRDAADNGSGSYTLSYLQRGRLNTAGGAHAVDALFVLLDKWVVKNSAEVAWIGLALKHRGVSYGTSVEDADIVTTTYTGQSQHEWSPASASVDYDGTWVHVYNIIPRYRFGTEVTPVASLNFEGYRVTISDGTTTVIQDIAILDGTYVSMTTLTGLTTVTVASMNRLTGPGDVLNVTPNSVTPGSLTP